MSQGEQCPVCQGPANRLSRMEHWWEPGVLIPYYQCRICGDCVMPDPVKNWWLNNHRYRQYKLSAFIRERHIHQTGAPMLLTALEGLPERPPYAILIDDAIADFPRNVSERLDRTIVNLAHMSAKPGSWLSLENGVDYPAGFAEDDEAFNFLLSQLAELGYLGLTDGWAFGEDVPPEVRLTAAGWNRVADLERATAGQKSRQAFVAMWFGAEVREAYEQGIKPAIEAAGYEPCQMAYLQHNEQVDDRMIAEIRKSRFLVADFTGHRHGVYWEAGFALGIDIPAIYTVREDEVGKCHFDTRQFNHVVWKTPEDLRERLRARIDATIVRPKTE